MIEGGTRSHTRSTQPRRRALAAMTRMVGVGHHHLLPGKVACEGCRWVEMREMLRLLMVARRATVGGRKMVSRMLARRGRHRTRRLPVLLHHTREWVVGCRRREAPVQLQRKETWLRSMMRMMWLMMRELSRGEWRSLVV